MNLLPALHVREVSTTEGTVLLDVERGRFYGLNPTGTFVWRGLSDGRTVEEIADDLSARFAAPLERIRADVVALVARLRDRGLLEAGDRSA